MAAPHEILRTFRFTPRLAPDLLREALRVTLPHFDGVRAESLAGEAAGEEPIVVVLTRKRVPVHAIAVAAPSACENALRVEWPRWARVLSERMSAPVSVLVVTADLVIERWARQPILLDGESFSPYVLGPSALGSGDIDQTTPVLVLMTLASLVTGDA
jgi:hypothetical protein